MESRIDHSISIVAVHGLNGHREKTWTAKNNILWLRDLLPHQIPNARIFSWGYDANTHSVSAVSTQLVYDHARTLISDLCLKRRLTSTQRRPIIFVCHSLGGLVVKSVGNPIPTFRLIVNQETSGTLTVIRPLSIQIPHVHSIWNITDQSSCRHSGSSSLALPIKAAKV